MQPVFAIRGFPGFHRVGRIRPVRPIDAPWRDGDGVSSDDDKEELGGVPAAIWSGRARQRMPPATAAADAPTPSGHAVESVVYQGVRAERTQGQDARLAEPLPSALGSFAGGEAWEAWLLTAARR